MEITALDGWFLGSAVVSYLLGLLAHEFGHAAVASAVGFHPRLISIGVGRPVCRWRFGQAWFVFRLVPIRGRMTYLTHLPTRRLRDAAVVAGGPLGNILLLALAGAVYLADPAAFGTDRLAVTDDNSFAVFVEHLTARASLDAFTLMQVCLLAISLLPARRKTPRRPASSDGWKLWHLAVDPEATTNGGLLVAYAVLMQDLLPAGAALPPPSPYGAEIVYQATRQDQRRERWADRDAAEVMQRLLQQDALPNLERAYVLRFLVARELTRADTGTDLATLDQWSREAVILAPTREHQLLRAGALRAMGQCDRADAIHWALARQNSTTNTPSTRSGWCRAGPLGGDEGFNVVIVDDDCTPIEFVVQALIEIFQMTQDDAIRIVLTVQCTGSGTCGVYNRTDAERVVEQMTQRADRSGYPLRCRIELYVPSDSDAVSAVWPDCGVM